MALAIEAEWEQLSAGSPEERACFSALGIRSGEIWLTEAEDAFVKRLRQKVHLSAYHLAEWLAWNWWRLRWEPRRNTPDWSLAHHLATIGKGYVWPNITIFSDGERIALVPKPTGLRPQEPLRYVSDLPVIVRAAEFENAVDHFIDQVRGQLLAEGIAKSNLHQIWTDVLAERADPEIGTRRKFEALLGFDPDEADEALLAALLQDAKAFGRGAMGEVAAGHSGEGSLMTAAQLQDTARTSGFDSNPGDSARMRPDTPLSPVGQVPAWKRGAEAAQALRMQERLGLNPISNERLAQLAGISEKVLTERTAGHDFSFALDSSEAAGRIVLRSKWETGRRFEVARLLGDRLLSKAKEMLFPATHASTYRQKMQRAFAAELLCPFDSLRTMIRDDYSPESIEEAAGWFQVSELAVRTHLVNHGCMDRENLEEELEAAAV